MNFSLDNLLNNKNALLTVDLLGVIKHAYPLVPLPIFDIENACRRHDTTGDTDIDDSLLYNLCRNDLPIENNSRLLHNHQTISMSIMPSFDSLWQIIWDLIVTCTPMELCNHRASHIIMKLNYCTTINKSIIMVRPSYLTPKIFEAKN